MFEVTTFLLRWLYLCNLVRDRAEIQSLPYTPLSHQHYHGQHSIPHPPPPLNQPPGAFDASTGQFEQVSQAGTLPHAIPLSHHRKNVEEDWRDQCLRGLLSYQPGSQRLMAMDSLRVELVQKLSQQLSLSDDTLRQFSASCRRQNERETNVPEKEDNDDPYLDADAEIVRAFGKATMPEDDIATELDKDAEEEEEAVLVISRNGTDIVQTAHDGEERTCSEDSTVKDEEVDVEVVPMMPTSEEVEEAHRTASDLREYLPQLVSAVLHSPPALTQVQGLDPIQKLRRLILTRCLEDPSWGIELCWLLEAEVGRAWKTLFEHRQQTGKRLIVVLPAERAAALAKIGMEKRGAFNLLQDAEQATAYGYMLPPIDPLVNRDMEPAIPRLPSSLSMRRCSHFGDTMHFIDRLTQISLDLRVIPNVQRRAYLDDVLSETNRRVRRRMITRGDVSLDVEDNRGPYDWPEVTDLTIDMLEYSVHFPLEPMSGIWPNGNETEESGSAGGGAKRGVLRVLNIVTTESRILASRERCPYLVLLEVQETGLDGSDARLYASGGRGLGTTIEEALGLGAAAASAGAASRRHHYKGGFPGCRIPPELMATPIVRQPRRSRVSADRTDVVDADYSIRSPEDSRDNDPGPHDDVPRGGWQADEGTFYPSESSEYLYASPYDMVRQQQYEQEHQQMRFQQRPSPVPEELPLSTFQRPTLTMKSTLLEKVYGLPWEEKVKQIRQTSAFGNVDGWRLASFIMKAGEDIRREALVMQVIGKLVNWFQSDVPESQRPWLRPYRIMCVGGDAGLIECVTDAKSIDEVKKQTDGFTTLRDYFERAYGPPSRPVRQKVQGQPGQPVRSSHAVNANPYHRTDASDIPFEKAQDNFLRSLVGYSLVCFILQIKDRHNANILLDREGHIIHIDFGFVLGDTPKMGKVPIFSERAPFKLSAEFWEVLGGWNFYEGGLGVRFCKMFEVAFACAAAHADEIVSLVEAAVLNLTRDPDEARSVANGVRSRLCMRGPPDSVEQKSFIMELVNTALTSWGTSTYDWLQKSMNGYQ